MIRSLLFAATLVGLAPLPSIAAPACADLVVVNANIRTLDEQVPRAAALATIGSRIVAVGDDVQLRPLACDSTRVIDAEGRLVLPGFNDSHVHFMTGGQGLSSVDLRDADSQQEFAARIGAFAEKRSKGAWVLRGNWDHENWTPNDLPTRQLIDGVTPDNPVFVQRLDGHMGLANSRALALAGITRDTPDPAGGEIVRDANGEPTGVLKDDAMDAVFAVIPRRSFDEDLVIAQAATDYAASLGVTSVQDMGPNRPGVYQELLRQGKLKTRIYAISPLGDYQRWVRAGIRAAFGDPMLRVGGLKGFTDGSLGSTTAWFFEPYLDNPQSTGLALEESKHHPRDVSGADGAGLQVVIHAIGDRANDEALKVFEQVARDHGERDRRFRIEHAQHLNDALIRRFADGGVIASMQPYHAIDDGRWAHKRLDPARLAGTYAFRSLLDAGGRLALGTDWAVAPLDPMLTLHAAVVRETLDGEYPGGWYPEQKLTIEEAVRAYTTGSAHAEFQEHHKGTLAPGMLADFVLWSQDIFTIAPAAIADARALLTVVDGRVVFEAK
ncbi:MAG TPA: amidohydrolase [Gammaproteobacteria bacterium]|nr:amidohydrolase [Luteimonas sp.]HRO26372.1 amidohydrolase [Luteimonas sp.]HRP35363.1 amidohydrolase [Gammaproteobacteria bacterium]HRP72716.1 amidohydrolase [Luteimonas sp.]